MHIILPLCHPEPGVQRQLGGSSWRDIQCSSPSAFPAAMGPIRGAGLSPYDPRPSPPTWLCRARTQLPRAGVASSGPSPHPANFPSAAGKFPPRVAGPYRSGRWPARRAAAAAAGTAGAAEAPAAGSASQRQPQQPGPQRLRPRSAAAPRPLHPGAGVSPPLPGYWLQTPARPGHWPLPAATQRAGRERVPKLGPAGCPIMEAGRRRGQGQGQVRELGSARGGTRGMGGGSESGAVGEGSVRLSYNAKQNPQPPAPYSGGSQPGTPRCLLSPRSVLLTPGAAGQV